MLGLKTTLIHKIKDFIKGFMNENYMVLHPLVLH